MKKIFVLFLIITNVLITAPQIYANDTDNTEIVVGLQEKMNALYLPNVFDEEMQESMLQQKRANFDATWNQWLQTSRELGKYWGQADEDVYNERWDYVKPKFENGFLVTCLKTEKYLRQYTKCGKLMYLLSDIRYWSTNNNDSNFTEDGTLFLRKDEGLGITAPRFVILEEGRQFLKDIDTIEKMLLEENENVVLDVKLFAIDDGVQFLYIQCEEHEYLIKVHDSHGGVGFDPIELFKLYSAEDVLDKIILFDNSYVRNVICADKPEYEKEAEELQADGLLQGNENGLDLLKPLTRAEAVALLIRALGLESKTVQYTTSRFSDISSDSWASPYAALAVELEITDDVSDTEFAPNNNVTSDQFATFVLRAAGESDIDYTKGTQILIDHGIITTEQAETMDLFTRGDMAKIIYEARDKGLL